MPSQYTEQQIMDARRAIARRFNQSLSQVTGWDAEMYLNEQRDRAAALADAKAREDAEKEEAAKHDPST